jgi:hypothetical protein
MFPEGTKQKAEYRIQNTEEKHCRSLVLRKWPKEVPVSLSIVPEDLTSIFHILYSVFCILPFAISLL